MKILRYKFTPPNHQYETGISLPRGAQILTVQIKDGENTPSIWAVVDTNQPVEERKLLIMPTGVDMPSKWKSLRYVDTFQITEKGITLCFHVFEQSED